MIRVNIDHLGRSGSAFTSKTNVIHCVFSGSDVRSKLRLLCYICSGVERIANCVQLTQDGSKVKQSRQSTIVGGACAELLTLPRISEQPDLRK